MMENRCRRPRMTIGIALVSLTFSVSLCYLLQVYLDTLVSSTAMKPSSSASLKLSNIRVTGGDSSTTSSTASVAFAEDVLMDNETSQVMKMLELMARIAMKWTFASAVAASCGVLGVLFRRPTLVQFFALSSIFDLGGNLLVFSMTLLLSLAPSFSLPLSELVCGELTRGEVLEWIATPTPRSSGSKSGSYSKTTLVESLATATASIVARNSTSTSFPSVSTEASSSIQAIDPIRSHFEWPSNGIYSSVSSAISHLGSYANQFFSTTTISTTTSSSSSSSTSRNLSLSATILNAFRWNIGEGTGSHRGATTTTTTTGMSPSVFDWARWGGAWGVEECEEQWQLITFALLTVFIIGIALRMVGSWIVWHHCIALSGPGGRERGVPGSGSDGSGKSPRCGSTKRNKSGLAKEAPSSSHLATLRNSRIRSRSMDQFDEKYNGRGSFYDDLETGVESTTLSSPHRHLPPPDYHHISAQYHGSPVTTYTSSYSPTSLSQSRRQWPSSSTSSQSSSSTPSQSHSSTSNSGSPSSISLSWPTSSSASGTGLTNGSSSRRARVHSSSSTSSSSISTSSSSSSSSRDPSSLRKMKSADMRSDKRRSRTLPSTTTRSIPSYSVSCSLLQHKVTEPWYPREGMSSSGSRRSDRPKLVLLPGFDYDSYPPSPTASNSAVYDDQGEGEGEGDGSFTSSSPASSTRGSHSLSIQGSSYSQPPPPPYTSSSFSSNLHPN